MFTIFFIAFLLYALFLILYLSSEKFESPWIRGSKATPLRLNSLHIILIIITFSLPVINVFCGIMAIIHYLLTPTWKLKKDSKVYKIWEKLTKPVI
jgi:uncharacterized membrane protein YozB (DUF420 family)